MLPGRNRGVVIALALCVERVFTVSPIATSNVHVDRILSAVIDSVNDRYQNIISKLGALK
jgi:hypothetical protein